MNKLKTSLLILMLLASISASAGYAPDSVQIALKKMYPTWRVTVNSFIY